MSPKPNQSGMAAVAAIFILVILAGLAAYAVSISATQQTGIALDVQGSRALQVARSGMDWGIARVVSAPSAFGTGNCQTGNARVDLSTGAGGDLAAYNGFTVSVECEPTPYTDGAALISYRLIATACNEPNLGRCPNTTSASADYVERQLSTQVMCNASGPC
ncbi:hypothetical protein [Massilia sp. CF038]|uniref:hypothetical protein n=1 Tax=Massilia sp. CF038 TaxID=1881045 RepID=UPI00091740DE|nr:hypothetical protein [Massilia sp. CF038]SHG64470.1 MSHA biogenesis protein MshP [Massilia sp. CF038]